MEIIDALIDILREQKYQMKEQARRRKDIIDKLDECEGPIRDTLINIYLWEDTNNNLNHWKGEIRGKLYQIKSLKGSNKYMTSKEIWNSCIEDWCITTNRHIDVLVDEAYLEEKKNDTNKNQPLKKPKYDSEKISMFINEYFKWLAEQLGDGNIIRNSQVSDKIDELLRKYK